MDQKRLAHVTKIWQKRLRLQDWQVHVQLEPPEKMETELGISMVQPEELVASIRIQDGQDDATTLATLVHELLHLRLAPFDADWQMGHEAQETAINLLASVLIAAFSRTQKGKDTNGRA